MNLQRPQLSAMGQVDGGGGSGAIERSDSLGQMENGALEPRGETSPLHPAIRTANIPVGGFGANRNGTSFYQAPREYLTQVLVF